MNQNHNSTANVPQISFLARILILTGLMILLFFVGNLLGSIFGAPFVIKELGLKPDWEPTQIQELMTNMNEMITNPKSKNSWYFLMILQGISHLGGFWIAGLAYLSLIEKRSFEHLNKVEIDWRLMAGAFWITLFFLPIVEITIRWNQGVHLPFGLHESAKQMEEQTARLTEFLVSFDQLHELVIAIVVIAVFAAVGEELIFRGLIQNFILKITNNHHVAIWIAAIIFSAIHFQFFGFVPRMLLGVLFGYLYVWSGNLWVPILGHFINNGLSVFAAYYVNQSGKNIDLEKLDTPIYVTMISVAIFSFLVWKFFINKPVQNLNEPAI